MEIQRWCVIIPLGQTWAATHRLFWRHLSECTWQEPDYSVNFSLTWTDVSSWFPSRCALIVSFILIIILCFYWAWASICSFYSPFLFEHLHHLLHGLLLMSEKANNTHKSAGAQMLTTNVFSFSVHLLDIFAWQAIKQVQRNNVSFTSLFVFHFLRTLYERKASLFDPHELNITFDNISVIPCSLGKLTKSKRSQG